MKNKYRLKSKVRILFKVGCLRAGPPRPRVTGSLSLPGQKGSARHVTDATTVAAHQGSRSHQVRSREAGPAAGELSLGNSTPAYLPHTWVKRSRQSWYFRIQWWMHFREQITTPKYVKLINPGFGLYLRNLSLQVHQLWPLRAGTEPFLSFNVIANSRQPLEASTTLSVAVSFSLIHVGWVRGRKHSACLQDPGLLQCIPSQTVFTVKGKFTLQIHPHRTLGFSHQWCVWWAPKNRHLPAGSFRRMQILRTMKMPFPLTSTN